MPIHAQWVTTGFEFDGHRIVGYRGVVRGITVRSRNLLVNLGAFIQTLFGGNITLLTELAERTRQQALPHTRQPNTVPCSHLNRGLPHPCRFNTGMILRQGKQILDPTPKGAC
jgi:hypothetical protein